MAVDVITIDDLRFSGNICKPSFRCAVCPHRYRRISGPHRPWQLLFDRRIFWSYRSLICFMQKLYPAAVKQSPAKNDEVGETAYLGGSVVSYILAKVEGDIVAADTLVEAGRLDYELGSKEIPAFGNKAMR